MTVRHIGTFMTRPNGNATFRSEARATFGPVLGSVSWMVVGVVTQDVSVYRMFRITVSLADTLTVKFLVTFVALVSIGNSIVKVSSFYLVPWMLLS